MTEGSPQSLGLFSPKRMKTTLKNKISTICLVSVSLYLDLNDVRFQCAKELCGRVAKEQIPLIICDDSPTLHNEIRDILESIGDGWVTVTAFKGKGKKGASLREGIAFAMNTKRTLCTSEEEVKARWVICFFELEKVDFVQYVKSLSMGILANKFDIVFPRREEKLFQQTYPIEQFYSETFGNMCINEMWNKAKSNFPNTNVRPKINEGDDKIDWLFGPVLIEANTLGHLYLSCNAESWDAQLIPAVQYIKLQKARYASVEIPYKHHPLQKQQEEGKVDYSMKRVLQLNVMTSKLNECFSDLLEDSDFRPPLIIVAGCNGNIGTKILNHLTTTYGASYRYLGLDKYPPSKKPDGYEFTLVDFSAYSASWAKLFKNAFCVFLLAAKNPFPEATSTDAYESMLINSNILEACAAYRVNRVVFASSSHVVGQCLHDESQEDPILANQTPTYGTKYRLKEASMDSTLYAAAKAQGEAQIVSMIASERLSLGIVLRIGWCQPGENKFETISVTGTPTIELKEQGEETGSGVKYDDYDKILRWFQSIYLSNADLNRIVDACISSTLSLGSKKLLYINGMSKHEAQKNSRWEVLKDVTY